MKRLLSLLMALAMTASLAACGEEKKWTALSSGPWKIRKEAPGRDDPEQPLIALHKGL